MDKIYRDNIINFYYKNFGWLLSSCRVDYVNGKKKYKLQKDWQKQDTKDKCLEGYQKDHNSFMLLTGKGSNIFVLDIDINDKANGFKVLKDKGIDISGSPMVLTPSKGAHVYYTSPGDEGLCRSRSQSGFDIRANGGFVGFPHTHIKGYGSYKWLVAPECGDKLPRHARVCAKDTAHLPDSIVSQKSSTLKNVPESLIDILKDKSTVNVDTSEDVACINSGDIDEFFEAVIINDLKTSDKTRNLFEGNWQGFGYSSQSEADLALCESILYFAQGNSAYVYPIFSQSGLYREDKWERTGHKEREILKAIDFYKKNKELRTQRKSEEKLAQFEKGVYSPNWDNLTKQSNPALSLNGHRILSVGNIGTITAQAGVGKTQVVSGICACVSNQKEDSDGSLDTFGFTSEADSCIYIDTEQSIYHHGRTWTRYMTRSGYQKGDKAPDNVKFFSISGKELLQDRLAYVYHTIETAIPNTLIIIDGMGDLVSDPNDSNECVPLIYSLSSKANTRNIAILMTMHVNPASGLSNNKARGVVGSELIRKSECCFLMEKVENSEGVRRITTEYSLGKNRGGKDDLSTYFRWDSTKKCMSSCEKPEESDTGKKPNWKAERTKDTIKNEEVLDHMEGLYLYKDLRELIENVLGCKSRSAEYRIEALSKENLIIKKDSFYTKSDDFIE